MVAVGRADETGNISAIVSAVKRLKPLYPWLRAVSGQLVKLVTTHAELTNPFRTPPCAPHALGRSSFATGLLGRHGGTPPGGTPPGRAGVARLAPPVGTDARRQSSAVVSRLSRHPVASPPRPPVAVVAPEVAVRSLPPTSPPTKITAALTAAALPPRPPITWPPVTRSSSASVSVRISVMIVPLNYAPKFRAVLGLLPRLTAPARPVELRHWTARAPRWNPSRRD